MTLEQLRQVISNETSYDASADMIPVGSRFSEAMLDLYDSGVLTGEAKAAFVGAIEALPLPQ